MIDVHIDATGDYSERCDGNDTDFKRLVAEAVGQPVRRIGRFIQLALIGAGRCAHAAQLTSDTAVYFGSGRGDLGVTIEVMQALLRDGHAPKPLSFINTVSNAACFYVAQNLRLLGRSSFVCNRYFAFETVLQLALLDLQTGSVAAALVGTVDVVTPPLADHCTRLELPPETPVADASHWLCLRSRKSATTLGRLLATENFPDANGLENWLATQSLNRYALSGGQYVGAEEIAALAKRHAFAGQFNYRDHLAYYDSQSGAAIGAFLRDRKNPRSQLLHVNRDPDGRYFVMLVER